MAYTFQVTIDSPRPHTLADWWAEALGWLVEPVDEDMIRSLIAAGRAREEDTTVHRGKLVWKPGAALVHPDGAAAAPRVLFQWVPEPKTVKNRVHLDIRAGEEMDLVADRLVDAGATLLHRASQGPFTWITLADPEGNELCVTGSPG